MAKEMTAEAFEDLRPRFGRMSDDSAEAARLVLVEGQEQSAVAKARGVSRQVVSRAVKRVQMLAAAVPQDWQQVDQYFPPAIAAALNEYADELKTAVAQGVDIFGIRAPDLYYALTREKRHE